MNKYIKHIIPRFKMTLMIYVVLFFVLLYPIMYLLYGSIWIQQLRNEIINVLDKIEEEVQNNSLW